MAGHSLMSVKLACFDLKMATAVSCYGNVGSFQSMGKNKADAGSDLGCLSFSCCLRVWLTLLLARHLVVQGKLASSETDYCRPCKQMQQAMVVLMTMKECPILRGLIPECG